MISRSEPHPACRYCKGAGFVCVSKDPDEVADCVCTEREISDPLPDLPGFVHGIKSVGPFRVQCDGCGQVITHDGRETLTTFFARIRFHRAGPGGDHSRRCKDCWVAAGVPREVLDA